MDRQSANSGYNMNRGWTQSDLQEWLQHVQRMDTYRLPKLPTTCTEDGNRQTAKSVYKLPKLPKTCTEVGQTNIQKWLQHVQRMETDRLPKLTATCTEDRHRQTAKSG